MAISNDAPEDRDALVQRLGLTYAVISDTDLAISAAFRVRQEGKDAPLPSTFVLDAARKVLWRAVGDHINDRPTIDESLAPLTGR